eukprot:m.27031 g.27031  ORF g.27031 m.27031 type:complete len:211 (-) comp5906_c0_seq1:857-1489(-)
MSHRPAASIALHAIVFPSLSNIEEKNSEYASAVESIRKALEKAEACNPGLTHEFVDKILDKSQSQGGDDLTEKLLRGAALEVELYKFNTSTDELKDLAQRAQALKEILSSIPDEVANRTKFLGIIRQIAEAIKAMLDAVNGLAAKNADLIASRVEELQQQRKTFVRGSKKFSDTLKQYFKDSKKDSLFKSAHRLVNETNSLLRTVKEACS